MEEFVVKIYSLEGNGEIFYIGCTAGTVCNRLKAHISEAKANHAHTNERKNKKIASFNYEITATILDMITIEGRDRRHAQRQARRKEIEWINKHIEMGCNLCNSEAEVKKSVHPIKEQIGQRITFSNNRILEETETEKSAA